MPLLGWFDALLLTTLLITIVCVGGWIAHDALRYRHERRLERMRINERIDRRLFAGEDVDGGGGIDEESGVDEEIDDESAAVVGQIDRERSAADG